MKTRLFWMTALLLVMAPACGRKTTRIGVPEGYREARTATPEELVELINVRYAGFDSLTVARMRVEFVGGSLEAGYLEEFPRARGYLLARKPDSVYVNIQNPVTSSTVVAMAANQRRFQIWAPRENKFLVGRSDLPTDQENPLYRVRPDHLVQAVLFQPLPVDEPGWLYFVEEDQDSLHKYYVIGLVRLSSGDGACLEAKYWIERSQLYLSKQHVYECGRPVSRIAYGPPGTFGKHLISNRISMERVVEQYTLNLDLEEDTIRVDRALKGNAFEIPMPPGAELVEVEASEKAVRPY